MSDKAKTANYRRCFITDGQGNDASGGEHLQSLITKATSAISQPWLRALGAAGSAHQLLTLLVSKNSCLCGELVYYEPGRMIPLVDIKKDGTTWQATVPPKDATGADRKFQEQSLYFAVRENHVAIIQSASLQADHLNDFFVWLIQSRANLTTNALIDLQNLPAKSALEKLKDHKIRGIKMGDKLFTAIREEAPVDSASSRPKRKKFIQTLKASPKIVEILTGLGIAKPIIDNLQKNPDPGSIKVDIEISYRSRTEKEGVSVLHALADTLGKQDGLNTEIRLDGKSVIKNEELSVRGIINVQCPNGCVAQDDAMSKLSLWLMEQVKTGKVA